MISAAYIAKSTSRLELELRIIRRFLLFPENRAIRGTVVAKEVADFEKDVKKYLAQKPDRDPIDELEGAVAVGLHERRLRSDLPHLIEFSENRLNQMELILRYTLFESFLTKIVGNILWEYPELRKRPIHGEMERKSLIRLRKKQMGEMDPDGERIAWTRAAVDAVDRLPFDEREADLPSPGRNCLSKYLSDAFGLSFSEKELWPALERLRQIRNHLIHVSLKLTLQKDWMEDAETYLANFPTLLVRTAVERFPKACMEDSTDDDDDGTPGYLTLELFREF